VSLFTVIEGDVTLRKSDGTETGVSATPLRTDPTGTTAQPVTDNGGSLTVDATSLPLPTGAATETTLAALNTNAADIETLITTLNSLVTAIRDTAGIKKITDQLPAGTNNIGDVDLLTWLGSSAPTVGQKTMANAIPVVFASDQTTIPVAGSTDEKTFTIVTKAVALGNGKSLLSIYNPTAATKKIKLREFYIRNSRSTAVTGVVAEFQIHRWAHTTTPTGGTTITARAHDTSDTLTESVDCRTGGTLGGTEEAEPLDVMRISTDEWGPGTADVESNQQAFANYLPARSLSSTVLKPFTANPGQGLHMKMATNTAVSDVDVIFVFTQA
jgi:hypothetical protein